MSIKTRLAKLEGATHQQNYCCIVLVIYDTDSEEVINAKRLEAESKWLSDNGLTEIPAKTIRITIRGVTPTPRDSDTIISPL